jgi:hypothetical protein
VKRSRSVRVKKVDLPRIQAAVLSAIWRSVSFVTRAYLRAETVF